jgi:hypothetical protein
MHSYTITFLRRLVILRRIANRLHANPAFQNIRPPTREPNYLPGSSSGKMPEPIAPEGPEKSGASARLAAFDHGE